MPSDILDVTLVLAGGLDGKTCVLAGYQFTDGKLRLQGERGSLDGLIRYLGKSYQAFPENSQEHLALVKHCQEEEKANGSGKDNGSVQGTGEQVESGVRQDGAGPSEVQADVLGAPDDGAIGGQEGDIPIGDGHEDAGVHREDEAGRDNEEFVITETHDPVTPTVATSNVKLTNIVMALDPENDKHWTEAGLPAMAAIEQAAKSTGIIRSEVEDAAPDHNREAAYKLLAAEL